MRRIQETVLLFSRVPTSEEKEKGAEVVFQRQTINRKQNFTIMARKCYESWEQWGAPVEILGDNVDIVEKWRRGAHWPL